MKKKLLTIIFGLTLFALSAQTEHAWVYFKDKPNKDSFLSAPQTMLSQRAIDRRTRYNIELDEFDVPIESSYVQTLSQEPGIQIMAKSKWLNAVHVIGEYDFIELLKEHNFIERIDYANTSLNVTGKPVGFNVSKTTVDKLDYTISFDYGIATNQIDMLQGDVLHDNGYSGQGMVIAILDAGFPNVDKYPAFERLRANQQILGGYDYVNRSSAFYQGHSHGMSVLSTIAGYIEGQFVGTAPDAQFYLFITEDNSKETPLEESLWVEAAEKADSLGVDLLNTSLGYSTFDNSGYDYSYNDLNGETTFITRGANMAFSRGMILLNSAGNSGNDPWHYINAPADAPNVISVGAVNATGLIAPFSSFGPTADGRIKPDVSAQGAGVYVVGANGNTGSSNGTSFSSPVLAGVVTCLWQAFPEKSNIEIVTLVRESGHLFPNSSDQLGYGIPDFESIYNSLINKEIPGMGLGIYPNPVTDQTRVNIPSGIEEVAVEIINVLGKTVHKSLLTRSNNILNLGHFNSGLYMVKMIPSNDGEVEVIKMIKN